jgi:hypothetical protein
MMWGSMIKTAPPAPEEQDFIISSLSPSQAQKRLALGVVLALLVAFFITAGPLSTIQLARIHADKKTGHCSSELKSTFRHLSISSHAFSDTIPPKPSCNI